ncbi:fibrocystin-like [Pitangus sulphuratus]|nr:fibrocystin-like [Pitangus sulphuratus]
MILEPGSREFSIQNLWKISFLSAGLIFLAVAATRSLVEPHEGSVAGGTWITITLDGSASHQLESVSPASVSQLEVSLVNPDLPRLPCDVSPLYFDLPTIRCRTRSSPQESLYYVEVMFKGCVINNLTGLEKENYSFKGNTLNSPSLASEQRGSSPQSISVASSAFAPAAPHPPHIGVPV